MVSYHFPVKKVGYGEMSSVGILPIKGHELYLGIDRGKVHSSQEELQIGDSLMGGAIGLRGKLWGINYDYFVGVPIKKTGRI